eukprot:TRINITY_DN79066_c0_g1_i1.p1 TRINITY_DN79066_c0_g1~~TRINITY_DN79066_c0_g1_i1.p1  ORF type:complete len:388 (+),score=57.76 TRINITY_DN79066_c0_g1_i1:89-1165(+)
MRGTYTLKTESTDGADYTCVAKSFRLVPKSESGGDITYLETDYQCDQQIFGMIQQGKACQGSYEVNASGSEITCSFAVALESVDYGHGVTWKRARAADDTILACALRVEDFNQSANLEEFSSMASFVGLDISGASGIVDLVAVVDAAEAAAAEKLRLEEEEREQEREQDIVAVYMEEHVLMIKRLWPDLVEYVAPNDDSACETILNLASEHGYDLQTWASSWGGQGGDAAWYMSKFFQEGGRFHLKVWRRDHRETTTHGWIIDFPGESSCDVSITAVPRGLTCVLQSCKIEDEESAVELTFSTLSRTITLAIALTATWSDVATVLSRDELGTQCDLRDEEGRKLKLSERIADRLTCKS